MDIRHKICHTYYKNADFESIFSQKDLLYCCYQCAKFSSTCKIIFIFSCILSSVLWDNFLRMTIYISPSVCLFIHPTLIQPATARLRIDGWMGRGMEGRVDGWMDNGYTHRFPLYSAGHCLFEAAALPICKLPLQCWRPEHGHRWPSIALGRLVVSVVVIVVVADAGRKTPCPILRCIPDMN